MTNEKKDTKWKPGESGNKNGRPRGSRNKAMSDKQLADLCGKRVHGAMDAVLSIMNNSANENARLKAALAIIAQDEKMRQFIYKKVQDAKAAEPEEVPHESREEDVGVVVSMSAIK